MVEIGETAPDFTLQGAQGDEIREFTLSEFANDRPVALVFYLYDFSPICTEQMCEVNDMEMLTFNDDAGVLGISTDGPYSHQRFIKDNDISYPLLTDVEKEVYEAYGMVDEENGTQYPERGVVLIDADRTVQYRWVAEDSLSDWDVGTLYDMNERIRELIAE